MMCSCCLFLNILLYSSSIVVLNYFMIFVVVGKAILFTINIYY
jgi:hypothetical protein